MVPRRGSVSDGEPAPRVGWCQRVGSCWIGGPADGSDEHRITDATKEKSLIVVPLFRNFSAGEPAPPPA